MGSKTPSFRPPAAFVDSVADGQLSRPPSVLIEGLAGRLANLCASIGLTATAAKTANRVFRDLIVPWSRVEAFALDPDPAWCSEISDDNTPIEFSVTLSPTGNEARILFEPQGETPTLAAHREAALRMHDQLELEYGADLTRFRLVQELFAPPDLQGAFALWSAVVFSNDKPPSFKAYFNPQAQGVGSSVAVVEEGLRRLGLKHAWQHLAATLARRGPHRDELKYFALDLNESEQARVKVYVRHHEATPEDLELAASAAPGSTPGEAEEFARAMGGGARRFRERATFTCAAFVGGRDDRPSATTQYVPVCAYALDDREVQQRVSSYLSAHEMDDRPYRNMLTAFANRPLDAGVGMQSWVAFRRLHDVPRLTVYLGSETRRVFPVGSVPAGTHDYMLFDDASHVLRCVAQYGLHEHPAIRGFARLAGQEAAWLLVSNASELLADTMDASAARLEAWLSDNAALGQRLSPAGESLQHAMREAVESYRDSPDAIEAKTALTVAAYAARGLAKALAELLETEELSSGSFSLEAILRGGPELEAAHLMELEAAGAKGLPSIVRGAFGVHQRLWTALDRIRNLGQTS